MKLALATWNGRVSPVFDVARRILLLDVEDGRVTGRREEPLPGTDPLDQADRLAALGPRTLICGAVSQRMEALLTARGVQVVPFTAGPVEEVLAAWLAGDLPNPALSMPGCGGRGCCGGRRMRGRRGRGGDAMAGSGWPVRG